MAELPDQETLQALLRYEPDTGKLFWKERPLGMFKTERSWSMWNTRFAGAEAFTYQTPQGYRQGRIHSKTYSAHRVIWKLVNGGDPEQIDHINGVRDDNRIHNLRSVSPQENMKNQGRYVNNSSGTTGISWHKTSEKWQARIQIQGETEYLGTYSCFEAASLARKAAEARYGFHPNHGRPV